MALFSAFTGLLVVVIKKIWTYSKSGVDENENNFQKKKKRRNMKSNLLTTIDSETLRKMQPKTKQSRRKFKSDLKRINSPLIKMKYRKILDEDDQLTSNNNNNDIKSNLDSDPESSEENHLIRKSLSPYVRKNIRKKHFNIVIRRDKEENNGPRTPPNSKFL